MRYTKTVYLINKEQDDGSMRLTPVSGEEWYAVKRNGANLAPEQRRYFIELSVEETDLTDRVILETSREEYLKWHRERMASARNLACGKKTFRFVSLDADTEFNASTVPDYNFNMSDEIDFLTDLSRVRDRLAVWKPWAVDMLDLYISGRKDECVSVLSAKYGVSERTIRNYRSAFKDYIRELLRVDV